MEYYAKPIEINELIRKVNEELNISQQVNKKWNVETKAGISVITITRSYSALPLILNSLYSHLSHKCDICGKSDFKTEDELSYHVRTIH